MNPTALVLHDVALTVIARLLVVHEDRDPVQAWSAADRLMNAGLQEYVERDANLRQIAQDIAREFGFDDFANKTRPQATRPDDHNRTPS